MVARDILKTLVRRIQGGDRRAEEEFVHLLTPRLTRIGFAELRSMEAAGEVATETLVAALNQIKAGKFRGDATAATWAIAILRNRIADYRSRQERNALSRADPIDDSESPAANAPQLVANATQETTLAVREALARLPEAHREVLLLNKVTAYTTEEIARRLGRNPNTVGRMIWEARLMFVRAYRGEELPSRRRLKGGGDPHAT